MSIDSWLQQRVEPLPQTNPTQWNVLGREIQGIISWNMNDTCNYRCSYCTQRNMSDRTGVLKPEKLAEIVSSFSRLPGAWEIKLSGGEPFRQPGLDNIVTELVGIGHIISVQTNFSAPRPKLESFLEATRGALNLFSASLHLEYDTASTFVERYEWLKPFEAEGLRFHVTSVGTPSRLVELRDKVAPLFRSHGIIFKVQPEKIDGHVRSYTDSEKRILLELGGHNLTGKIAHNFQGKLCRAGANYLVIKSTGKAYRCYPASRKGGKFAELGSLESGLQLSNGPRLCPYTLCNCTVPIQRGMIEGYRPDADEFEIDTLGE